ncbi:MAG: acyltransferase, partial [Chloroflexi bacterium]|nr:acyltransferase [Chloroflexota bacterium]
SRPMRDQGVAREPIVIEDDCWIASGAIVLAGVTIGRGSVVAAGSVVTHDVPPYSVVAGMPARVLRSRRDTNAGSSDASA